MGNIVILYLDNNKLTGEIPSSIGNLITLQRLYLINNCMTGEIPGEICNIYDSNPDFRPILNNNRFVLPQPDCIKNSHIGYQFDPHVECPFN